MTGLSLKEAKAKEKVKAKAKVKEAPKAKVKAKVVLKVKVKAKAKVKGRMATLKLAPCQIQNTSHTKTQICVGCSACNKQKDTPAEDGVSKGIILLIPANSATKVGIIPESSIGMAL